MTIQLYRKKPVVIEAIQYNPELNHFTIINWLSIDNSTCFVYDDIIPSLTIKTLEGDMLVSPGDYIIKGVKGEFYPCKPDTFEATYEEVNITLEGSGLANE